HSPHDPTPATWKPRCSRFGMGVSVPVAGERRPKRPAPITPNGAQMRGLTIRLALPRDIDGIKAIADQSRAELGFHTRQSFAESVTKADLLVAANDGHVVGFLRFHLTQAGHATLREVATSPPLRGRGIGRALILALVRAGRASGAGSIRLSCPVEL